MPAKSTRRGAKAPRKSSNAIARIKRPGFTLFKNTTGSRQHSGGWGLQQSFDPFPPRIARMLTYDQWYSYGNGNVNTYGTANLFRLNSLFNPDKTAGITGHQPYGYDQLTPLYLSWRVNGVTIKITATDPSDDGMVVGCLITSPGSVAVLQGKSINQMSEKPDMMVLNINSTGSQTRTITRYFSIADLAGVTPLQIAADTTNYSGSEVSSPILFPTLHIAAAEYGGELANNRNVRVHVKLTFHAEFWNRKTLNQS